VRQFDRGGGKGVRAQGESAHLTSRRDISGRGRGFRTLRERERAPAAGTWNREEGRFRESEGEEGGGTWNPHRWRGASAPVCPHLGPAALIPSAAANPVRPPGFLRRRLGDKAVPHRLA